jgi:hypothetical protein
MNTTYPRVSSSTIGRYINQKVLLVGEVISQGDGTASIRTCDNNEISVHLPPGEQFEKQYVQVICKVESARSVDVIHILNSSDTFDMENYNKALELTNGKYKDLFA